MDVGTLIRGYPKTVRAFRYLGRYSTYCRARVRIRTATGTYHVSGAFRNLELPSRQERKKAPSSLKINGSDRFVSVSEPLLAPSQHQLHKRARTTVILQIGLPSRLLVLNYRNLIRSMQGLRDRSTPVQQSVINQVIGQASSSDNPLESLTW